MKANNKLRTVSIILLFFLGLLALYGGWCFISDPSGKSILQGCVLIVWLTAELIFNIKMFSPVMHYPLYRIGILLIAIGSIINKRIHQ